MRADPYTITKFRLTDKRDWTRNWRENNKEKFREINRNNTANWRKENPERLKEIKRKEYLKNRTRYLEASRQWRLKHPAKVKQNSKKIQEKRIEIRLAPRCHSCESILKELNAYYCSWCIKTYHYETTRNKSNHQEAIAR